jgi:uncharacterized membrane protein
VSYGSGAGIEAIPASVRLAAGNQAAAPQKGGRRTYLDVLRGVAVLVMIEAHVIDSWTRDAERHSRAFGESLILGGFGAPLFLFLAGVAVVMSAGSKSRRSGDAAAAMRAVQKRGVQIFLLAFVFRVQSLILSHGQLWTLLKVDILNVMGLSIVAAAALWGWARGLRGRLAAFAAATAVLVWSTPVIRGAAALASVPDWLEGYLRPIPGLTNFTFFPWSAFVMGGACLGVALDAARTAETDRRVNFACVAGGFLMALAAYRASFLPALNDHSRFWTTSASFFFIRLGLMIAAIGVAYLWEQRPTAGRRWSPLQVLGRSSLFIYWIHVEMVYGLVSLPLHGAFTLPASWAALAVFCGLMIAAAVAKDWTVDKFNNGNSLRNQLSRVAQPLMF